MTKKLERFNEDVERMKDFYRKFTTEKLRQLDQQGATTLKTYIAAVREVLKEREHSN